MPQNTETQVTALSAVVSKVALRFISAAHTITTGDYFLCDATSGAFTITLPAAGQVPGRTIIVQKVDSSVNGVTVDGAGSETINGALTQALAAQYNSITIRSDGTQWFITSST